MINASMQVGLSLALTFGVPLILGLRELLVLRQDGRGRRREPLGPQLPGPDGEDSHPALPAALIPNLPAIEARKPEALLEMA